MDFKYIQDTYGEDEALRLKTGRRSQIKLTVTYYPALMNITDIKICR